MKCLNCNGEMILIEITDIIEKSKETHLGKGEVIGKFERVGFAIITEKQYLDKIKTFYCPNCNETKQSSV